MMSTTKADTMVANATLIKRQPTEQLPATRGVLQINKTRVSWMW